MTASTAQRPRSLPRVALSALLVAACGGPAKGAPSPVMAADAAVDATSPGDAAAPLPDAGGPLEDAAPSCSDTQSDPSNCGACGEACLRGKCEVGVCASLAVTTLASGQELPAAIAVDATNVYWLDLGIDGSHGKAVLPFTGGAVMMCAIDDCAATAKPLVTEIETLGLDPSAFAIDNDSVYWAQTDNDAGYPLYIVKCAKTGCGGVPTVVTQAWPSALATDATTLYFTTGSASGVFACSANSCPDGPRTLWSDTPAIATAITLDSANVYFMLANGPIMSCPKGGCLDAGVSIAPYPPAAPISLVVVGPTVYWLTSQPLSLGAVVACPTSGCLGPTTVVGGLSSATALATDGTNLYWAEMGDSATSTGGSGLGRVAMCAVAGCNGNATTLAAGLTFPTAIAVDSRNVYFATSGGGGATGSIQMIAK
jgi:hypothetical protein